jgi:hypothetical protein
MNNGTTYDVSHSLVEKRVQGKVLMDREMQALASTRKSMAGKPGVLRIMTEREAQERDRDQFYGPNLPVAWGEDLVPPKGKKGSVLLDFDDDEDAEDSPTEDVSHQTVTVTIIISELFFNTISFMSETFTTVVMR